MARQTERLTDFLAREYAIAADGVAPAKRGYYGETWRVDAGGHGYFVKIVALRSHQPVYRHSFPVIEHLNGRGVDFISKIVKASDGRLWADYGGATLGVFEWIDGDNVQNERTKVLEYQMLCRVYALSGPGLDIPAETFSAGSADAFYRQWAHLAASPRDGAADALALLENRRTIFDARRRRLAEFSARCRSDGAHFYITHGDAGGNVILDGERRFLVDWDDAMYAPPERDAWFCLHWDWAMAAFAEALAKNGLNYALRPERLAYHCYHWFFHYLTLYLATFFESGSRGLAGELSGYLGGWIEDNLRYADSLP